MTTHAAFVWLLSSGYYAVPQATSWYVSTYPYNRVSFIIIDWLVVYLYRAIYELSMTALAAFPWLLSGSYYRVLQATHWYVLTYPYNRVSVIVID